MPYLQFKGRIPVENYHRTLPHHTLEIVPALSVLGKRDSPSLSSNLIIEGDNLLALKALLPTHAGQVNCAYIDPPYNTGNEHWVFNDNYHNNPLFEQWLDREVGKEGEDYNRHDKWCCMMLPRLMLLRDLLADSGVILVSIDDNEAHRLRMLMDEVFGEENFIAQLVWDKTRKNDAKFFSTGHDYVVIYAKSLLRLKELKTVWREEKPGASEIVAEYHRLRGVHKEDDDEIEKGLSEWFSSLSKNHPSKKLSRYKRVDKWGPWRDRDISWPSEGGPKYDVLHPKTGKPCRVPANGWRYASSEEMLRQIELGLVVFREDESEPPFCKRHLLIVPEEFEGSSDESVSQSESSLSDDNLEDEDAEIALQVMPSIIQKQSQVSVKHLRHLMGKKVFDNPKDHEVLSRLLNYVTGANSNALFLDCTAGSGTTAQAVLELNHKGDGSGKRRFVLVQQKHDTKDNERKKVNICETITRERVRRVIKGINSESLGGSFTYARVSEKPMLGQYRNMHPLPTWQSLAEYIFYTETSYKLDLAKANPATGYIGSRNGESFYLLYDANEDSDRALDAGFLNSVVTGEVNRKIVVYCEKLGIHHDDLRRWQEKHARLVRHQIVPFHLK